MNSASWLSPDMEGSGCLAVALFSSVFIQGIFHVPEDIPTNTQKVSVMHSLHQSLSLWKNHRATLIMKILTSHSAAIKPPLSLQSTAIVHKWWGWWTGEWAKSRCTAGSHIGVSIETGGKHGLSVLSVNHAFFVSLVPSQEYYLPVHPFSCIGHHFQMSFPSPSSIDLNVTPTAVSSSRQHMSWLVKSVCVSLLLPRKYHGSSLSTLPFEVNQVLPPKKDLVNISWGNVCMPEKFFRMLWSGHSPSVDWSSLELFLIPMTGPCQSHAYCTS